jgi:hypothetical protein
VLSGRAELTLEGQTVNLERGDWLVPDGAQHRYRIREAFVADEATTPPAHAHGSRGMKASGVLSQSARRAGFGAALGLSTSGARQAARA